MWFARNESLSSDVSGLWERRRLCPARNEECDADNAIVSWNVRFQTHAYRNAGLSAPCVHVVDARYKDRSDREESDGVAS